VASFSSWGFVLIWGDAIVKSTATVDELSHFLFEPRHEQFRQTVRQFVEQEVNPHADEWEQQERVPKSLFLRGAELGFFAHGAPEKFGGTGIDCRMAIVMGEELSKGHTRGVGMGFGAHNEIAKPHLVRFGTETQQARYLGDMVAGRKVGALGVTEPAAGSNVAGIETTAMRSGDGWILYGQKIYITNSLNADLFFIAAKTAPEAGHRGISMFLVERDTPGFGIEELHGKLGRRSSDTGRLTFERCHLPPDALLGRENEGFYQIMQCFENERLVIAAGCVGAADGCLDDTRRFVQTRTIGAGRLADMQVTRQRLAKSYMELEAARELVYASAWRVVRGIPSLKEVAMAKAFAAEAACRIIDDCLQLHGGSGYFSQHQVQRAYRDIRLDRIGGGTTEVMYDIIAKQLDI
jgi:alkylation response protein AidB-like acyl-CoA dehydrogenase